MNVITTDIKREVKLVKDFSKFQPVKILTGTYVGEKAWFDKVSVRAGGKHCFVYLQGRQNVTAAQVLITDIEAL